LDVSSTKDKVEIKIPAFIILAIIGGIFFAIFGALFF